MLTIKEPIKLKNNPSLTGNMDNFNERIQGNYEMLQVHLQPEDFLHLVTAPPEVYIAEEGMANLVNDTNIYKSQNVKLDVINNVINRILLTENNELTYQDQVFITNVLQKLGITDVNTFMQEVRQVKNDHKRINELTRIYSSHTDEIKRITNNFKNEQSKEVNISEENNEETKLYLHQDILNRLQTADIYSTISKFASDYHSDNNRITHNEYNLSEQQYMLSQINLNNIQNKSFSSDEPLVYQKINSYEYVDEDETIVNEETINKQLVSATLLNAIDKIYTVKMPQILAKKEVWFPITEAIYESAEDTFYRFEKFHQDNRYNTTNIREVSENIEKNIELEITELNNYFNNFKKDIKNHTANASVSNTNVERNTSYASTTNNYASQNITNEDLTYNETNIVEEEGDTTTVNTESIEQTLYEIEQKNIENQNKINQILQNNSVIRRDPRVDIKKLQKDALRAISNPEEVIMEYRNYEDRHVTEIGEQILEIMEPETRTIFETISQYRRNPAEIIEKGLITKNVEHEVIAEMIHQDRIQREREETNLVENKVTENTVTKSTIEKWNHIEEPVNKTYESTHQTNTTEFVHKIQEQTIDEEVLQEIINESRTVRQTEIQKQNITQKETVHEMESKEFHTETIINEPARIESMINQGLQSQINNISDQVYTKLERRLNNERMRRGRN